MRKRIAAGLLTGLLILNMTVVAGAAGQDVYMDDIFIYALHENGTASVTGLTDRGRLEEILEVPASVQSGRFSVTSVGRRAFYDANVLRTLIFPESVSEIGSEVCWHCDNLRFLTLPHSLEALGSGAFGMCGQLREVTMPGTLPLLEERIFYACGSLAEITLPAGLQEIGESAFESCRSLRSVLVPEGTAVIGADAFAACERLNNLILPPTVERIGSGAFADCGRLKSLVLPDSITEIADDTFNGCVALTEIALPEYVKQLGARAFSHCVALRNVEIFSSLSVLGEECFSYCSALQEIAFPQGLTRIGARAFYDDVIACSLPLSLASVGEEAFNAEGCVITYPGSEIDWLQIEIGPGNTGITEIVYGSEYIPAAVLETAQDSSLALENLQGTKVPVIRGLEAGRTAPEAQVLISQLYVADGEITVVSRDGEVLAPEAGCGTGCTVQGIGPDGAILAVAYVIVDGDVLGTGILSIAQLVCACQAMIGTESLTPLALAAIDADSSGTLDIGDIVAEARRLLS